jgi:putative intracellular protease/amidase
LENINQYSGIIIPGGQGLMADLIYDKKIKRLLKIFKQWKSNQFNLPRSGIDTLYS